MALEISKLKNGLTIATENRETMKSVALGVWVKVGSRNELENQHGIAHLLEHMAFKGTKKRTALEIASAIENVGGDINAATSMETTGYFIRILEKDLPLAIDILSDIITNPLFEEHELEREKQVILQEIGAANDTPDDVVFDQLTEIAWPKQAIGRPILGTPETVKAFSSEDLRHFMRQHYAANNMVIVACGAVNHQKIIDQFEESLGSLPATPSEPIPEEEAHYLGGDDRQQRTLMDTQMVLGFEGVSNKDQDFYATHILSMILGGGMSSRLFQQVREKRGLCYSIYAFHWAFADTGLFGIHTATDKEGMPQLMPVVIDELIKASQNIGQKEVDRARAQYSAGLIMGQENVASRAATIARQLLFHSRVKKEQEILHKLAAVTPEDVQKVANRLFFNAKPTFVALGEVDHITNYEEIYQQLISREMR